MQDAPARLQDYKIGNKIPPSLVAPGGRRIYKKHKITYMHTLYPPAPWGHQAVRDIVVSCGLGGLVGCCPDVLVVSRSLVEGLKVSLQSVVYWNTATRYYRQMAEVSELWAAQPGLRP